MANVTPEMIDAALRTLSWESDGAVFPDAYSDEEVAMERESMRKCLEAALNAAPQPQASAEDVALVEIAMRAACDELMGRPHMAAWQRLKGLLGVGHG